MIARYQALEERAAAVRLAAGIHGLGHLLDADLLAAWGRPLVRIRRCSLAAEAYWFKSRDGRNQVTIPEKCGRWGTARRIVHEFAHGLLDVGLSPILRDSTAEELRQHRKAKEAREWEELLADEWALAVWLPHGDLKANPDPAKLQEQTALPQSVIKRRLRRIESEHFALTYLPAWSAARSVRLEYRSTPKAQLCFFQEDLPLVSVPVTQENRYFRLMRMKGDLLALKPKDLLVKYGAFKVQPGESLGYCRIPRACGVDLAELEKWAKERTRERERRRALDS